MIWWRELPSTDLLVKFLIRLSFEGKMSTQECIQKYTAGPDVCRRAQIVPLLNDFRSHVRWRATENLKLGVRCSAAAEAEIDELEFPRLPIN